MSSKQTKSDTSSLSRIVEEARQSRAEREKGYRERALKIFPRICARCGREFSGRKLRELTVHHKDHDHDNNPPDGSNWELLCIYCHDNEHSRLIESDWQNEQDFDRQNEALTNRSLAGLAKLLEAETKKK